MGIGGKKSKEGTGGEESGKFRGKRGVIKEKEGGGDNCLNVSNAREQKKGTAAGTKGSRGTEPNQKEEGMEGGGLRHRENRKKRAGRGRERKAGKEEEEEKGRRPRCQRGEKKNIPLGR